jgi:hypothetical protein
MFKGSNSTNFKTDKPKEKVYQVIQDNLETLGNVEISDRGQIKINASRFSGFIHDSEITGTIREKEGKYTVELEWEAKPKWLIFIIVAFFSCGLGLALLILPIIANSDMQKKAASALDNIRFEFSK